MMFLFELLLVGWLISIAIWCVMHISDCFYKIFGDYGYNRYENLTREEKIIYSTSNNILRAENWKVIESMFL